jgi:hypothetical protein
MGGIAAVLDLDWAGHGVSPVMLKKHLDILEALFIVFTVRP